MLLGSDPAAVRSAPRLMSLNRLSGLRSLLTGARRKFMVSVFGMDIHPTVMMSLTSKFDMTFPKGVHVGEYTYVAFGARILTHDRTRGLYLHTRVGRNCFIGGDSLIMPGVVVGDNSIVGAGSVVTKDVPPRSIVAGNPAQVRKTDIEVGHYGRFLDADDRERALRASDPDAAALPDKFLGKN